MIEDLFDSIGEFEDLLDSAEGGATTGWEMDFVSDLRERFEQYRGKTYLSEKQIDILERLAG